MFVKKKYNFKREIFITVCQETDTVREKERMKERHDAKCIYVFLI